MTAAVRPEASFGAAVKAVADGVAAAGADAVDRESRFPREAIDALREAGALSAYVPVTHGGGGVGFRELARACTDLGRACSSTGMVFAMHQIQVGCLVRHGGRATVFDDYLERLARDQRLIASVTSEVGVGGDLRSSIAAAQTSGDEVSFEKKAPTVSYGAHADDFLTTVRRSADAEASDQVLVLTDATSTELEPTSTWDSLGMRGTCSPGYVVRGRAPLGQVLPDPFARIAVETMVPFSHLLWGHVWLGIATAAYDRARALVRSRAGNGDGPPATARQLSELAVELHAMRSELAAATDEYEAILNSDGGLADTHTVGYAVRINMVKISASERAPRICTGALALCGIAGYLNTTPFSVGRQLRDALSGALMIANERIHATNAALLLVHKGS